MILKFTVFDFETIYLLLYAGLSIGSFFYIILSPILLIEFFKRFSMARQVVNSIIIPWK